jgi:CRISPR system Cascade subunit CasA
MTTFDLREQPWIPAVVAGEARDLSLRDALVNAHEIESLDHADPLVAVALYRLLLAVVIDASPVSTVDAWRERRRAGRLDRDQLGRYLGARSESFDLFHPTRPFFQVATLQPTSGRLSSPALLMPEVASGNNVPLFSSAPEDAVAPLTPAQAARRLLACHGFDTAAIKTGAVGDPLVKGGKTTGNRTGPLGSLGVTIPLGRSLFETLAFNTPVWVPRPDDHPAWSREIGSTWQTRQPAGVLDLLTWQSRRVRLVPDEAGQPVVRRVMVAAGDRMEFCPADLEPHTLWQQPAKSGPAAEVPARHPEGRSAWRGLSAMLAASAEQSGSNAKKSRPWSCGALRQLRDLGVEDSQVNVFVVGVVYGNQSAVIEDIQAEVIPLPMHAVGDRDGLRQVLDEAVDQAKRCSDALNALDGNLRRACGGDPVPWDKGSRPGETFIASLDAPARDLLRSAQAGAGDLEGALLSWERVLSARAWDAAAGLLDAAPAPAVRGRQGAGVGRDGPMRLDVAESFFRASVRKTLIRLAAATSDQRKEGVA